MSITTIPSFLHHIFARSGARLLQGSYYNAQKNLNIGLLVPTKKFSKYFQLIFISVVESHRAVIKFDLKLLSFYQEKFKFSRSPLLASSLLVFRSTDRPTHMHTERIKTMIVTSLLVQGVIKKDRQSDCGYFPLI